MILHAAEARLTCALSETERTPERRLRLRHIDAPLRRLQGRLCTFGGLASALDIDFVSHFGGFGQDGHLVVLNFHVSARNGKMLDVIAGTEPNLTFGKLRGKRRMVIEDPKFSV